MQEPDCFLGFVFKVVVPVEIHYLGVEGESFLDFFEAIAIKKSGGMIVDKESLIADGFFNILKAAFFEFSLPKPLEFFKIIFFRIIPHLAIVCTSLEILARLYVSTFHISERVG